MPHNRTACGLCHRSSGFVVGTSLSALSGFGFDGEIDFGAQLQFHVLPAVVHPPIGNLNFFSASRWPPRLCAACNSMFYSDFEGHF